MRLRSRYISDTLLCVKASGGMELCMRHDLSPEQARAIPDPIPGLCGQYQRLRPLPPSVDCLTKDVLMLCDAELKEITTKWIIKFIIKEQVRQNFSWTDVAKGKTDPINKERAVNGLICRCIKHACEKKEIAHIHMNSCMCRHGCWISVGKRFSSKCFFCYRNQLPMRSLDECTSMYVRAHLWAVTSDIIRLKNGGSTREADLQTSLEIGEVCVHTFHVAFQVQGLSFLGSVRAAYAEGIRMHTRDKDMHLHVVGTVVHGQYCEHTHRLMTSEQNSDDVTIDREHEWPMEL